MPRSSRSGNQRPAGERTPPGVRREIGAGQFKATCLAVMDRVRERREEYVITKHGRPVAKLVPVGGPERSPAQAFGWMKGSVTECGDVIGPTGVEWDAERDESAEGPGA